MGSDTQELRRRLREYLSEEAERAPASTPLPPRVARGVRLRAARTAVVALFVLGLAGYWGVLSLRGLGGTEPGPAATPACSWSLVSVPAPGDEGDLTFLWSVAAVSDEEVWTVGQYGPPGEGGVHLGVIERWDGGSWSIVETGDPQAYGSTGLTAVASAPSRDVWTVGWETEEEGELLLLKRWDGIRWTAAPAPESEFPTRHLNAVTVLTDDDVWAVGGWARPGALEGGTYTLHFDGREWTEIPSPQGPRVAESGGPYSGLNSVAAVSPDDVWAVGQSTNVPQTVSRNLALHWNGSEWSVVPTPDIEPRPDTGGVSNALSAVAAVSSDDVWAVGSYEEEGFDLEGPPSYRPLALHWDGVRWGAVPLPDVGYGGFNGITALSPNDIWAVGMASGDRRAGFSRPRPLLMHWDGTAWSAFEAPRDASGLLEDVAATPLGTLWAVGNAADENYSVAGPLALRCA